LQDLSPWNRFGYKKEEHQFLLQLSSIEEVLKKSSKT